MTMEGDMTVSAALERVSRPSCPSMWCPKPTPEHERAAAPDLRSKNGPEVKTCPGSGNLPPAGGPQGTVG